MEAGLLSFDFWVVGVGLFVFAGMVVWLVWLFLPVWMF